MTTTTKPSPVNNHQRASGRSAGAPPPTTDAIEPTEPSIGAAALASAINAAAAVADTFLMTTGLRPAYETPKGVWQGATRAWNGEPLADVMYGAIVPKPVREATSFLDGVDTMKQGEVLSCTFEVTAALEGVAARREVAVGIEKGARGFTVTLEDAGGVGLLAADQSHGAKAKAGAFDRAGMRMAIEVATLDEAKSLAKELAVAGGTSVGALIEGYHLTHPGLREVELSASVVAELGVAHEDAGAELGLEGAASMGTSARFVASSPPELVVSKAVALDGTADVSLALGGVSLGKGADADGKVVKQQRYALPDGTTPADLPALLARGDVLSREPRMAWEVEASVRGLDGKQLTIKGVLRPGEQGVALEGGSVEWRLARRIDVDAGGLHGSTGAEVGTRFERTVPLRHERFNSARQLEGALRSVKSEMTRAF